MSKYDALWAHVAGGAGPQSRLTFEGIEKIAGAPIDHSFLNYKKELMDRGWRVKKISRKGKTVLFESMKSPQE